MLKIERLCHSREVTIRLRTKDSVFTKHLALALALSILFHFGSLLFVEISDRSPVILLPLPQVTVETDLGLATQAQESTLVPEMVSDGLMPRYVLEPEASCPEMPRMPTRQVNHRYISDRDFLPIESTFSHAKHLRYAPDAPHFSFIRHYNPVKIHVSGELAELRVIDDGMQLFSDHLKRPHLVRRCTVRFHVQVDTKRGKVFWFNPVLSSGDEELDEIAEQVLSKLSFDFTPTAHIQEGEVEIQFQVERKGPYDYLLAQPVDEELFYDDAY